jgi:hypothetical protein
MSQWIVLKRPLKRHFLKLVSNVVVEMVDFFETQIIGLEILNSGQ